MKRLRFRLLLSGLAGCAAAALVAGAVLAADPTKREAEAPARSVISRSLPVKTEAPAERPDDLAGVRKAVIESPVKDLVRAASGSADAAGDPFVNPKVEPGRVKWHPSFAAACEAAKRSGKPVLLFHLLGKLDDQFC